MNAPSSSTPVPPSSAHTTRPFKTEPFVAVPWERADLDSIVSRPFGIYLLAHHAVDTVISTPMRCVLFRLDQLVTPLLIGRNS